MVVLCEYVWLGGGDKLRSKTRVIDITEESTAKINTMADLRKHLLPAIPSWNYDGSSTQQAEGHNSEIVIKPVSIFRDPFRANGSYLIFCETYGADDKPLENNHRPYADKIFKTQPTNGDQDPWYGIEQEYFLGKWLSNSDKCQESQQSPVFVPMGFMTHDGKNTPPQGQYYCSVGADNSFGREIANEHLMCCLRAGLKMSGINAEVAPGQWEYQIGPLPGMEVCDQLWISRYILERVSEKFNVSVSLDPKPVPGDWNGSGCHTNYSTKYMREGDGASKPGISYINEAVEKLSLRHTEHMKVYGDENEKRMTGKHETASYENFTSGIANRQASVRIGNETAKNKQGYFEDRRPGSNMNPYLVTAKMFETTILWDGKSSTD